MIKDGTHGTHRDDPDGKYFLLSAKNIQNGKVYFDKNDRKISQSEFDSIYKNYYLQKNDLLLSIVGTIGRLAIFQGENNLAFQRSVAFFRFKIFDECHRSQFGETHKNIVKFFPNAQMFGFTRTPIFADNATSNEHGKRTTSDLFQKRLHEYVITNAIADENVLKFSVEYWGKIKRKDGSLITEPKLDREFFSNPERINLIVDWIIANHNRKTHGKKFSAILCVSNVDTLISYYETFNRKQSQGLHDLRVITIFTLYVDKNLY